MSRLIDADELTIHFRRAIGTFVPNDPTRHMKTEDALICKGWVDGLMVIQDAPTIESKKGKWIERECGTEEKEEGWETVIVCSRCDFPATTFYSEDCESRTQIKTHFCPNCGCDMRGGDAK